MNVVPAPKHAQALAMATIIAAACACAAPRTLGRHWGNLEGEWLFRTDPEDVGETEGWLQPEYDDSEWRTLSVPGHWEAQGITDPRPGKPPKPKNGLPYTDYDGVAWYRLRFVVPADWEGEDLVLQLGSVDDLDRTYLNGTLVGETGRDVPRAVTVRRSYAVARGLVRFGAENVIALRVEDAGGPGGFMGPLVSLLPESAANAPISIPQGDRPLDERFAEPPAESRILKIIHGWPDDPAAQNAQIRTLASQGFGGVVCNVSHANYLESEEKWDAFVRAVNAAKQAGMALWLYDEKGYPSGAAGGIVLRDHPEWEARGLLIAESQSSGAAIALELPPGKLLLASAYPVADGKPDLARGIDLAGHVTEGSISWQPPPGQTYQAIAITEDFIYEGTHASLSLADKLPYINLLMPEPTARFVEVTHGRYVERLGDDLGECFVASFTDEPSLMNVFMRPMPYRVLPWAPNLPEEFERRRGYALEPRIPELILAGEESAKVRYDFWLTVAELVSENYFGQIEEYCRAHNIPSGGHLLWEEDLRNHVAFYGDFFRCIRRLGAPSIDCLTSVPATVPWQIARLIGSAADLDGKPITMCETSDFSQRYRPEGDDRPVQRVSEAEIRGTCNRLMAGGITTITSYYSFAGIDTMQLRALNEWVGRCATLLTGGHQATDIAVVYPIESLWPRFTPARHRATDSPSAAEVEQVFDGVSEGLFAARRDFTYIDSRTLAEGAVADGAVVHGDMRWRVIVLPYVDTLPDAAWRKLAELERTGGVIVAVAARPTNSAREFPSARTVQLGERMLGTSAEPSVASYGRGTGIYLPPSAAGLLPMMLDTLLEPDAEVRDDRSPIRMTHRRIDGREVYFLINDSGEQIDETVSLCVSGSGKRWDPATGDVSPVTSGEGLPLHLGPHEGIIYTFGEAREAKLSHPAGGALPGMIVESLPRVEPTEGHGEFVRAEVRPDEVNSTPERAVWRAVGTLTKGAVDTFLFTSFNYPEGIDLSRAESLVIDTWAPDGQATPSQILCILHERNGANYLAPIGRSLATPGHVQAYLPLSKLQLAGWSKDANGRLDADQIIRVSIGWGGYFGTEGETITYGLALPRTARRTRSSAEPPAVRPNAPAR